MAAGKFDHIIQFRRMNKTASDGLSRTARWADHGTKVYAEKKDVSDSERFIAKQVAGKISTRFKVRGTPFSRGITTRDRIMCNGLEYFITGLKESGKRGAMIEFSTVVSSEG